MSGGLQLRHITVSAFLLEALRNAQDGLRRGSIDEFDVLLERCRIFGRAQWPEGVVQFIDNYKRGPGRMRSERAEMDRFEHDPNRVAAAYAAELVRTMRPGGKGPYKVSGSSITVEAVRRAVEFVNETRRFNQFNGKADPAQVAELLRHARGRFPGN